MNQLSNSQPVIWCLLDGKPGHANQALGLAEAIDRQCSSQIIPIHLNAGSRWWRFSRIARSEPIAVEPKPDLILGAGHRTHLPLIWLRRRFGGHAVVLMRPSLPTQCFDLCFIPDVHHLKVIRSNVVTTTGVLNRVSAAPNPDPKLGLFLVGGPSKHHRWSDESVDGQISNVIDRSPDIQWTLATSRRTPASLIRRRMRSRNFCPIVEPDDVPADWLLDQYAICQTIWVTEDSVSMVYEAATAGNRVGLIELPPLHQNRVTRAIDSLVECGYVTRHSQWQGFPADDGEPRRRLDEANRCAKILLDRFLVPEFSATSVA